MVVKPEACGDSGDAEKGRISRLDAVGVNTNTEAWITNEQFGEEVDAAEVHVDGRSSDF